MEAFDAYMSGVRLLPKDWPKDHKIDPPPNVKNAITGDFLDELGNYTFTAVCLVF